MRRCAIGIFDSSNKKRTGAGPEELKHSRTTHEGWQVGDKILNHYEIHQIKQGGMGIVYICYDHEDMEPVVIKTFQDKCEQDRAVVDRFKWEAETWVKLENHLNIVKAEFVEDIDKRPYIFLEYVAADERYGADLSDWIYNGGLGSVARPDIKLILNYAVQFCHGMMHAEKKFKEIGKPFVHQDIKPQNIMVTRDKVIKVTDFGLVKAFVEMPNDSPSIEMSDESNHRFSFSKSGNICGTPPYMSPEQCRGGEIIDTRSDIYSFGCVLYEMIVHKPPFVARTLDEYIHHHLKTIPESPMADKKLDQVVLKCLEKEPTKRYQDFGELERTLSRLYQEYTGKVVKPSEVVAPKAWELNNKGVSLLNLGLYKDALECYNEALSID